ncbi:unnamed protein product [Blepharisma stoltei]|uniref:Uncharacterized protein n=1 Tax=Blepharisma stoltei TaxID=1481888 RepID=A0AAU9JYC8_9CILI|nr:unnamed protein product [Blepharisma stoltei]
MKKKCFESGCTYEVEYSCKCSSPETLSCKVHIGKHLSLQNRTHGLESMFSQPCEGTKEAILEFLTIENSKYSELRRKIIDSYSQCPFNLKRNLRDFTKKLDDCSGEINDFFAKISQIQKVSKLEQDPILGLLVLQPREAVEKVRFMIKAMKDWYNAARFFYIITEKLASLDRSFVKEKCDAHLENMNMQNNPELYNKTRVLANVKDSVSLIKNVNSLKRHKNVKKPIKNPPENKASLLNFKISTASNDLKSKPKGKKRVLNVGALRNKIAEILSKPNNPELEKDFRKTCSKIQTSSSFHDPPLMQAYQDYLKAYQQKTSLYSIREDYKNKRADLHIYNTETETKEVKILQTPQLLDLGTCITQLPNSKLFCFGKRDPTSGIAMLIDLNGGVEILPSGTPCSSSSCIYFNNSVYCFGVYNKIYLTLSSRFDLDQNRWIHLTPIPKADYKFNSIIFSGNILISGYLNRNLWLYSIDIDSFSTIPYEFAGCIRKILINAESLYLIECDNGSIYESEVGSYLNWRQIGKSKINCNLNQVYCSYNKGGICIGTDIGYFKFDFKKNRLAELKSNN